MLLQHRGHLEHPLFLLRLCLSSPRSLSLSLILIIAPPKPVRFILGLSAKGGATREPARCRSSGVPVIVGASLWVLVGIRSALLVVDSPPPFQVRDATQADRSFAPTSPHRRNLLPRNWLSRLALGSWPSKVEHVLSTTTYVRDRPQWARDFQLRARIESEHARTSSGSLAVETPHN